MRKKISTGISFDKEFLHRIDNERGDIPRSKYILRKLQQIFYEEDMTVTIANCREDREEQKMDRRGNI